MGIYVHAQKIADDGRLMTFLFQMEQTLSAHCS
jgi:hypothetical protein